MARVVEAKETAVMVAMMARAGAAKGLAATAAAVAVEKVLAATGSVAVHSVAPR